MIKFVNVIVFGKIVYKINVLNIVMIVIVFFGFLFFVILFIYLLRGKILLWVIVNINFEEVMIEIEVFSIKLIIVK